MVGRMASHVSVANTIRYLHFANDMLMAAAEAGATKLDVNWSKGYISPARAQLSANVTLFS